MKLEKIKLFIVTTVTIFFLFLPFRFSPLYSEVKEPDYDDLPYIFDKKTESLGISRTFLIEDSFSLSSGNSADRKSLAPVTPVWEMKAPLAENRFRTVPELENLYDKVAVQDFAPVHLFRPQIAEYFSANKKVFLSFDDGPSEEVTPFIMDVLDRYNVKAVFLVQGYRAAANPHIIKALYDAGHIIGNHSWAHANYTRLDREALKKDIIRTNDIVRRITGVKPVYLRPPYGEYNDMVLEVASEEGMRILLWNVDPKDWEHRNPNMTREIAASQLGITSGRPRGGGILLHDTYRENIQALEMLLNDIKEAGLQIVSVSEFPNAKMAFWNPCDPVISKSVVEKIPYDPASSGNVIISLMFMKKKSPLSFVSFVREQKNGRLLQYLLLESSLY
ncbi:MAG: polysaccharide deacetylase family protein [Candidatus Riflebacteria bacterium]|nr:polysaccharide deacetylase family protein [Candidatus Riflebacteria bacterium]